MSRARKPNRGATDHKGNHTADTEQVLLQADIFDGVPESVIRGLVPKASWMHFEPDAIIYCTGERQCNVYILAGGTARTFLCGNDAGKRIILDFIHVGGSFGLVYTPSISQHRYHSDWAEAAGPNGADLVAIPLSVWERAANEHPEIYRGALAVLGEMLHRQQMQITDFVLHRCRERLASALLHLSNRLAHVSSDGIVIDVPLPHMVLSQMIGMSREHVTLNMKSLRESGAISVGSKRRVIIKDADLLASIADAPESWR